MDSPRCTPSRADGTNGYKPSTLWRRSSPLVGPLSESLQAFVRPPLVPFQSTSPSGVAGPQGAPCDVPEHVRLGRPWGPRLAMLVYWPGTLPRQVRAKWLEGH